MGAGPLGTTVEEALAATRVVPVVVLPDAAAAVPVTGALVAGGLPVVEITLRTPDALAGLARAAAEVPAAIVGAGTVLTAVATEQAIAAGARFVVSPGFDEGVVATAREHGVPVYPGVATATEVMRALAAGLDVLKFFPAAALGGPAALGSLAAAFPGVRFLPTGGIDATTAPAYLARPEVLAVGGSWMVDRRAVTDAGEDWGLVRARAAVAAAIGAAS